MDISNDLHTLFEARRDVFEIVDGQPTDADLHCIVEELAKLLYPIQFDKEGGKHKLIGLIMEKANYTKRFGATPPPSETLDSIRRIDRRQRDRRDPRQNRSHTLHPHHRLGRILGGGEGSTKLPH